jgi:hypothetical protein
MTFKSINVSAVLVHGAVGTKSSAALYTVPVGKVFYIKEILEIADSSRMAYYIVKSGGAVLPDVGTNTDMPTRIIAVGSNLVQALTSELTSTGATINIVARNTIMEAGDKLFVHNHEAAGVTRNTYGLLSGDESSV